MPSIFYKKNKIWRAGFTLVELLVVMSIFIIITALVLARQNKFSSDIVLTDLAYQVAISIRQAQVYGLGVKATTPGSDIAAYETGYGIHFDASPNTYKFFADANKSGVGETNEISAPTVASYQLNNGVKISKVCAYDVNNNSKCVGADINFLDLIYIRPDPSAVITSNLSQARPNADGTFILPPNGAYNTASIAISSALGDRYKCVNIYQTGQVAVSNLPPGQASCPHP